MQVHPCADAFYQSKYFPVSVYCFGKAGGELKYDPLELLCKAAHENQLKIEAWFNPYRVSQQNKIDKLSDDNIAKKWYKEKNGNVVIVNQKIYFNPASKAVQKRIVAGVREIVKNYPVDGIHFDDYLLPSSSTGFLIPVFFFEHPVPVISIATILPVKTKTFPHFFISNTSLFNITNQLLSVYRISIFVNQFTHSCHTWIYHIFYDTFLID